MKYLHLLKTGLVWLKNKDKRQTISLAKSFKNKIALEIGGPSNLFKSGYFPVYQYIKSVDGVNFSNNTIWEGEIKDHTPFHYFDDFGIGTQYIDEVKSLKKIPNNKYDLVLSCHSLEHTANPILAIHNMRDKLVDGGTLCLIVPNKKFCFDIHRPYTSFTHVLEDYKNGTEENDTTHCDEFFKNFEYKLATNPPVTMDELKLKVDDNINTRVVHHHVFSLDLIAEMLHYCGFEISMQKEIHDLNLFTLAKKIL